MPKARLKDDMLEKVHELINIIRTVRDPNGLTNPIRDALLIFHTRIGIGPELERPNLIQEAWRDLGDILDYHEPHYARKDWWGVFKTQYQNKCKQALDWADNKRHIRSGTESLTKEEPTRPPYRGSNSGDPGSGQSQRVF